jgi:hypothetical protein
MKDSKNPFGSVSGSHSGTPAKAAASVKPAGTPVKGSGSVSSGDARGQTPSGQSRPQTGKVVHDERGTAVWDWLKQTGRNAIESTTRMLRKLEAPELKVEQPHEEELRIQPDNGNCTGGGYDPYNQPTKQRRTPTK